MLILSNKSTMITCFLPKIISRHWSLYIVIFPKDNYIKKNIFKLYMGKVKTMNISLYSYSSNVLKEWKKHEKTQIIPSHSHSNAPEKIKTLKARDVRSADTKLVEKSHTMQWIRHNSPQHCRQVTGAKARGWRCGGSALRVPLSTLLYSNKPCGASAPLGALASLKS